jgi:hypothetical protein
VTPGVVEDHQSFWLRRLIPLAWRRRYHVAVLRLLISVVCLVIGLVIGWPAAFFPMAISVCVAVLAIWSVLPILLYRRRYPWSLIVEPGGIWTWNGPPPMTIEQHLPWVDCHGVVVTVTDTPGCRCGSPGQRSPSGSPRRVGS